MDAHSEVINKFLDENKFFELTDVQKGVMPEFLDEKSLLVLAQTGSGKTFAYCLPLCIALNDHEKKTKKRYISPRAVVLVPTRELAGQVTKALKTVSHIVKVAVRNLAVLKANQKVNADIIVATPGLLTKFNQQKLIQFDEVRHVIVDEFDQVLDPSFRGDMNYLFQKLPIEQAQVCLFSATFHETSHEDVQRWFGVDRFKKLLYEGINRHQITIDTFNIDVRIEDKKESLIGFLKKVGNAKGIVFFNKKTDTGKVFDFLSSVVKDRTIYQIHGDLNATERRKVLKSFNRSRGILLATDIAARGVHVPNLEWVLNYDIPFEAVYYLHRAGRCGREGKKGIVYNFVVPQDKGLIKRINGILSSQTALKIEALKPPKGENKKTGSKKKSSSSVKGKKAKTRKTNKRSPRFARSKKK